jgi:hypothetical protein
MPGRRPTTFTMRFTWSIIKARHARFTHLVPLVYSKHLHINRLFCQFAAPLAYNYLGLTLEAGPTIQHAPWMDSKATGTIVFTRYEKLLSCITSSF